MKSKMSRQQYLGCPVCEEACRGPQGLHAHVRSAHPAHYREYGVDPRPEEEMAVVEQVAMEDLPEIVVTAMPSGGSSTALSPVTLVDQAIEGLRAREAEITSELNRLDALRKEGEGVSAQIAALTVARNAFGQPEEAKEQKEQAQRASP